MDNIDNMNTPETLANLLDEVIPPHQTTIHPQNLMGEAEVNDLVMTAARLSTAPTPILSPEAFTKIQAQVRTTPIKKPLISLRLGAALAAAATVILIAVAILLLNQSPTAQNVVEISTATFTSMPSTVTATETVVIVSPSETATTEASAVVPSATPVENTSTPTLIPNTPIPSDTADAPVSMPTMTDVIRETPSNTPSVQPQPTETTVIVITPTPQAAEIIIEGVIEKIEDNTLTIYGFNIQLDPNDPLLKVLRVDDMVRIEGDIQGYDETLTIIALKLELQNDDEALNEVYIQGETGEVWRDDGNCANRPPDWAVANGWRKRCEQPNNGDNSNNQGQPQNPGQGNGNNQGGRGMGNDDDDDDD